MNFGKYQLRLCKYGWMLFFGPYIGKCFELYGEYSEAEISVLRAFLGPGAIAIDVGANIGDLTVPMARFVGETGRVYAIESHLETYHVLCANLALNGIKNVKALNCFIATSPETDTAGAWGKFGYVSEIWGTNIVALDSLGLTGCSFLKIDVDGKELEVLKSGEQCVKDFRPVIYFENDVRETSAELLQHLMDRDYDLYWHPAPIFNPNNFFGNPTNHWHPQNIISLMVLAIPREKNNGQLMLRKVSNKDEWWDVVMPQAGAS